MKNFVVMLSIVGLLGCSASPPDEKKTTMPVKRVLVTPAKFKPKAIKKPDLRVLMTIDDLPVAMANIHTKPQGEVLAKTLCDVLTKHNVPTLGFVNMKGAPDDPKAMAIWKACKPVTLANHTWSHPRMRRVGIKAYLDDVKKGHEAIKAISPPDQTIYFRYPYLYEGFDPVNQKAVRDLLKTLESPNVPVTILTSDWYHARGYVKALKANKTEEAARYKRAWRWDVEQSTMVAEWGAQDLFKRQPPQVILLHANPLTANSLEGYIKWLKARGYRFVGVDEVLRDEAFKIIPQSSFPTGGDHWSRVRRHRSLNQ